MAQSLAIKTAMLLATVLLVTWIGWPTPHDPVPVTAVEPGEGEIQQPILPHVLVREEPTLAARPAQRTASIPPAAERPQERSGKLDLNRATAEELQSLPGIGPVLAQRVVEQRTAHGRFHTVDDLQDVKGIGKKRMDQLRPLVMVDLATKTEPNQERKIKAKAL
ncbi:MAG TPA: helix-hairpin-helix domain-containing protein [Nitrospiraceae bacterium]|nr:helix-hairpin-helix domain-containing protein [Nitrospiraceae bacterium]